MAMAAMSAGRYTVWKGSTTWGWQPMGSIHRHIERKNKPHDNLLAAWRSQQQRYEQNNHDSQRTAWPIRGHDQRHQWIAECTSMGAKLELNCAMPPATGDVQGTVTKLYGGMDPPLLNSGQLVTGANTPKHHIENKRRREALLAQQQWQNYSSQHRKFSYT
mmetsp:Transcript_27519/g.58138  ORF Transcript_27519/g.58138 Transcript_27519/m.58138 type:complete len:161 (+) Transcript_27519:937-1419(+)